MVNMFYYLLLHLPNFTQGLCFLLHRSLVVKPSVKLLRNLWLHIPILKHDGVIRFHLILLRHYIQKVEGISIWKFSEHRWQKTLHLSQLLSCLMHLYWRNFLIALYLMSFSEHRWHRTLHFSQLLMHWHKFMIALYVMSFSFLCLIALEMDQILCFGRWKMSIGNYSTISKSMFILCASNFYEHWCSFCFWSAYFYFLGIIWLLTSSYSWTVFPLVLLFFAIS